MLFNIQNTEQSPLIPKRDPSEIMVLKYEIKKLITFSEWFFTNGQANTFTTDHNNDITYFNLVDGTIIINCDCNPPQKSNFLKYENS